MNREEYIKDQVDQIIYQINNELSKRNAYVHTYSVCLIANIYSKQCNLDSELLQVMAMLHDIAKYKENCGNKDHALKSSMIAHDILVSSNLFTKEEIVLIVKAIALHSDKQHKHHNEYVEALKDCDLLARYFDQTNLHLEDSSKHRLYYALEKLGGKV